MDLNKLKGIEEQSKSFKKEYDKASGEKFAGPIEYEGSYVLKAKTTKYIKDDQEKQFPDIAVDKNGGYRANMLMEVAPGYGTQDVLEGSSCFLGFPITSGLDDPKKKRNAANMCKGRVLALAPKEIAEAFELTSDWLLNNFFGEFEESKDSEGEFNTTRETKLNDLVYVKLVNGVDNSGRPRLEVDDVRKAKPKDRSVQGKKLELQEYDTSSQETEEPAPQIDSSESGDNTIVDDVIDKF